MKTTRLRELICFVLANVGVVSRLKLAKIVYLIEWNYYAKSGTQLTNAWYMRERRGPVPATFGKDLEAMRGYEVELTPRGQIGPGPRPRFREAFQGAERRFLLETLRRYKGKTERDLLLATYLTPPMKAILKEEKGGATRKHHGVVFGRFPRLARSLAVDIPLSDIVHVAPEDMTDEDMLGAIVAFAESVPLLRTAEELLTDADEIQ